MKTYEQMRATVRGFLLTNGIDAYDLVRIAKDLCCCRTCKHYVQHYSKDGEPFDFGHCIKHRVPSATKPSSASCGAWECEVEE